MAKLSSLAFFCLVLALILNAQRLVDAQRGSGRDEPEDEPELRRNTDYLLNFVMMDGGMIKGGTVTWFHREGKKVKCIDGKKTLEARCKWMGMVTSPGAKEPKRETLLVYSKYCNRAGLAKPAPKIVNC